MAVVCGFANLLETFLYHHFPTLPLTLYQEFVNVERFFQSLIFAFILQFPCYKHNLTGNTYKLVICTVSILLTEYTYIGCFIKSVDLDQMLHHAASDLDLH